MTVLATFLTTLLCVITPEDSLVFSKLESYLAEVDRLSIPEACEESDFIIGSVPDSALRNRVAERVYRHWRKSRIMGYEGVAVHVFDKWFADFTTVFEDMDELDEAEFHSFINRSSLVGCRAPQLTFLSAEGDSVTLPAGARWSIIYFYSSECPKCLYTSIRLRDLLNSSRYKVNFYAVYTQEDMERWGQYSRRELKVRNTSRTKVYHLYGGDVDYVVPYGVVQTPRLFLVDGRGVIVGRNLDVPALEQLLR